MKKTWNLIFILIGILALLFTFRTIYRDYNFEKDNQFLLELKSKAGAGEVKYVLDKMEVMMMQIKNGPVEIPIRLV